jgi:pimeloyl-ACP methyl ester carboxylesterase
MSVKRVSLVAVCCAVTLGCGVHTKPFRAEDGSVLAGSIATMEYATIGGTRQHIWFRGRDRQAPPLIILHAGPGVSEAVLFRQYDGALEDHFLVVYWEQRGAGRSYDADIPPESMTVAQYLRDLDEVVDLVRNRFGNRSVIIAGHSWGTVLGTIYAHDHPDKVAAYVGIGQFADVREGVRRSYQYALEQAEQRGDGRALRRLRAIGPEPRGVDEVLAVRDWVDHFGGGFHADLSIGDLIRTMLTSDETNFADLWYLARGSRFSLDRLWSELSVLDLRGYRSFAVPVFFLLGRHDWEMPATLAAAYFDTIDAPHKRLVWFEQSAHYVPFEEPRKFERVLIDEVLPFARGTPQGTPGLDSVPNLQYGNPATNSRSISTGMRP